MREGESAINKYYFYNQKKPFSLKNKLERSNVTDVAQRFSDFLLAYFISSLFFFFLVHARARDPMRATAVAKPLQ